MPRQLAYVASGNSFWIRSTFSRSPPTKTTGIDRVAFDSRSASARSRPCEGIRDRSTTIAAGGAPLEIANQGSGARPVANNLDRDVTEFLGALLGLFLVPVDELHPRHGHSAVSGAVPYEKSPRPRHNDKAVIYSFISRMLFRSHRPYHLFRGETMLSRRLMVLVLRFAIPSFLWAREKTDILTASAIRDVRQQPSRTTNSAGRNPIAAASHKPRAGCFLRLWRRFSSQENSRRNGVTTSLGWSF